MTDPAPLTEVRAGLDAHHELAGRLTRALDQAAASGTWTDWAEIRELQRRAGQVLEDDVVARLAALERVRAAVAQLADLGPVSEIVDRGPGHAADARPRPRAAQPRSRTAVVAEALHVAGDPQGAAALLERLRAAPARSSTARRGRAAAPPAPAARSARSPGESPPIARTRSPRARPRATTSPRPSSRRPRGGCSTATGGRAARSTAPTARAGGFAAGFGLVYERAMCGGGSGPSARRCGRSAGWADARRASSAPGAIRLAPGARGGRAAGPGRRRRHALRDLLTRREVEVLGLMVRGETNAGIARELVVAEGTVKFHVKNVLRKLHASNRAEATSRYLRLTLRDRPPGR